MLDQSDAAPCVSWVSPSLRPLLQLLFDSDKVSLHVTAGSSCTTQVLFDRNVTYLLPSSFWKTIQFSSLPNALTFLDCFSHSSCAPQWCLCTRAAIYRNIGELEQGWTGEQSDLFIFSDCNFCLLGRQWGPAMQSVTSWAQKPNFCSWSYKQPLISVLDTDGDLFNTFTTVS